MSDGLFISSALRLLQLPSARWSRTLCALSRGTFPRLTHCDPHRRRPRIAAHRLSAHVNDGLDLAVLLEPDGRGSLDSGFHLAWCEGPVRCMRAEAVVPFCIGVQSALDGIDARQQHGSPRQRVDAPVHTLHLRIEMPCANTSAHVGDAQLFDCCSERLPDLAPVIGDQEPRTRSPTADRLIDQLGQTK